MDLPKIEGSFILRKKTLKDRITGLISNAAILHEKYVIAGKATMTYDFRKDKMYSFVLPHLEDETLEHLKYDIDESYVEIKFNQLILDPSWLDKLLVEEKK